MRPNKVKRQLRAGEPSIGTWLSLGSPLAAEQLTHAGFDWLNIEQEHAAIDATLTQYILQAISIGETVPMVRVPWNTGDWAKRALDAGAYGVVIPMVNSREEAELAVRACKYPPEGLRSVGGVRPRLYGGPDYVERANEEIAELNASLQQRVDEATAELQERYEQLRELDRTKSQFLSMASHELKTPITAMSGFLQVALRRVRKLIDGRADQAKVLESLPAILDQLEVVYRQTGKLARLIDELLDVSRIQTGRVEFRFAEVDLGQLAEEVAQRLQTTTTNHRLEVARDAAPMIVADRDHLEQVLNNLIVNAIKYSPHGGPVKIGVYADEDGVRLEVRDRGIGIPAKELDAIFGLFYRSPDRAARDAAGMGLGLYISREIVSRHGGRIWAESAPEKGSAFIVTLPRAPGATRVAEPTQPTAARP
jgi:two-component system sensor histidine kinase EvgS